MRALSLALAFVLAWSDGTLLILGAVPQISDSLEIVILDGDKVQNDIAQRAERELIVQVQDMIIGPIGGAEVLFTAPASGAGGFFSNGARTETATTNAQGIAISSGFRPNTVPGDFQITVEASYHGQKASATITETNLPPKRSGSGKWILIIGAIGGGVAAAAAATGKKSNPQPQPTIQSFPGTPTVGPPPG